GVGNVGSRVVQLASALGMRVLTCDPPRAAREPAFSSSSLRELVDAADVLTLHVPLERRGTHPTWHLIGAAEIAPLRPAAVLLNPWRGGGADDRALAAACAAGRLHAVLDVWENEPEPRAAMVAVARFATPHIAGYSLDGKIAGTGMIADALQRFLGAAHGP